MSKTPQVSVDVLLKLAGCEGNETAAGKLSDYLNGAKFCLSPSDKLGPIWKDDWDRRLSQIGDHADKLANLMNEVAGFYPYNAALGADDEFVERLRALAIAAKAQRPQKNQTALDLTCSIALMFLREHSQIKIRKGATGDSFRFVHKFAECIFARELASDGPGGTNSAYSRAVKSSDISGQNLAPTPS